MLISSIYYIKLTSNTKTQTKQQVQSFYNKQYISLTVYNCKHIIFSPFLTKNIQYKNQTLKLSLPTIQIIQQKQQQQQIQQQQTNYSHNNMIDDRIVFKVIMLGTQGVGKSSMLIRYVKGNFTEQYNVTVGVQFATKAIQVQNNREVKLQIWDTAGQQTFKAIVRTFYKGIAAVFLAFSINSQQSLQGLTVWYQQVKQHGHQQVVFFLVGTKADLEDQRRVGQQQIQKYLKQIGAVFYIETSAKYGTGIQQMFTKAAQIMFKKYKTNGSFRNLVRPVLASGIEPSRAESFDLNRISMDPEKKNCCR